MTATAALTEQTYTPAEAGDLAPVFDFLAVHQKTRGAEVLPQYALVGAGTDDRVDVPEELHRVLVQVVDALRAGRAVTVTPRYLTMTTQQAADLLGVSRPTVVKLIDDGDLPAERIGTRRRLKLADVQTYRERRREEQYAALYEASTETDLDSGTDENLAEALERLRTVRKRRAASRRGETQEA